MSPDPLDSLLNLENTFYNEGYNQGFQDGTRTGRIEGRLYGLTQTFEIFSAMGKLHGRAVVWSERMVVGAVEEGGDLVVESDELRLQGGADETPKSPINHAPETPAHTEPPSNSNTVSAHSHSLLPPIPPTPRLEKHIRTLYALTEPASLSVQNTEDAVADFNDRLRRAEGKVKIIEKIVGEEGEGFRKEEEVGRGGSEGVEVEVDFTGR
ncbi:MAG: hypothetical protein Q9178_002453 [Gyalolechia marmorata]